MTLAQSSCLGKFGGNGDGCSGGGWSHAVEVLVTNGDDADGGKGWWGGGDECLHHPWLSNSPSSELSSTDVTQPNCGALEQHITFTLIVVTPRWRLFRVAMWSDGG